MKLLNKDIGTYTFFGLLIATVWAIPLAVFLHRDAQGRSMELPGCDDAASIDRIRAALEEESGVVVLGLYNIIERRDGRSEDVRRCTATVVTAEGEMLVRIAIGWHDRVNAIPFWSGDRLRSE